MPAVEFERLVAASPDIARHDALWRSFGYVSTGGRLFRCKDGSWTARLVWRNRGEIVSTVTYTVRGLRLT
jgi:hypothetical protein